MSPVPARPQIYHITHGANLAGMVSAGGIWSDAQCVRQRLGTHTIGMSEIKRRRLEELEVKCHLPTKVG